MSWKKNIFSYILWGAYLFAAVYSFWAYGCLLLDGIGVRGRRVAFGWGILSVVAAALLFAALHILSNQLREAYRGRAGDKKDAGSGMNRDNIRMAAEGIAVVVLLAFGLILRVSWMQTPETVSGYYELAKVGGEGSILVQTQGAVYLYLKLLRGMFMVFGNKQIAGIWLQIFLQMLGTLLFYCAVRKIAGRFPAVLSMAYLMLAPFNIAKSQTYSPGSLFFCIYAVGIWMAGTYLKKLAEGAAASAYGIFLMVCMGFFLGEILYLDISGISLLALLLSVATLNRKRAERLWSNPVLNLAAAFLVLGVFFVCQLMLDARIRAVSLGEAWNVWLGYHGIKAYDFDFWHLEGNGFIMFIITGMMVLTVFSYWCNKRTEKLTPWFLLLVVSCVLGFFHMQGEAVDMGLILPSLCVVSCGLGLQACVGIGTNEEAVIYGESGTPKTAGGEDVLIVDVKEEDRRTLDFIENPLPLPKKKERKIMDYAFIPDESQMKYDIEVDENDDFDL